MELRLLSGGRGGDLRFTYGYESYERERNARWTESEGKIASAQQNVKRFFLRSVIYRCCLKSCSKTIGEARKARRSK
jgi:hypothetical protein